MKLFILTTLLVFLGCLSFAQAQTGRTDKVVSEVTSLRNKIVIAIKQRDQKTLATLYADDFIHTHASGQTDNKTKRIGALVSGEPTIESAQVDEINVRSYGATTALATGQSSIETVRYRWTIVYFKTGKIWHVVASHATRIADK